jgi:hypothetical protein
VALLLMISPPLLNTARLSSPDFLSALFVLGSFYFIIEKPSLIATLVLMVLAVLTRLDNIVTCSLLLAAVYFSKKWEVKLYLRQFIFATALLFIAYLLAAMMAKEYGWGTFFYKDFASRLHPIQEAKTEFSFSDYFRMMREHVINGLGNSFLSIFLAILALNFSKIKSLKKSSIAQVIGLTIPIIVLVRILLYPEISDRFNIAFYMVIIALTVKNFFPVSRMVSLDSRLK